MCRCLPGQINPGNPVRGGHDPGGNDWTEGFTNVAGLTCELYLANVRKRRMETHIGHISVSGPQGCPQTSTVGKISDLTVSGVGILFDQRVYLSLGLLAHAFVGGGHWNPCDRDRTKVTLTSFVLPSVFSQTKRPHPQSHPTT